MLLVCRWTLDHSWKTIQPPFFSSSRKKTRPQEKTTPLIRQNSSAHMRLRIETRCHSISRTFPLGNTKERIHIQSPKANHRLKSANYPVKRSIPPSTNQMISNLAGREGLRKPIGGQYEGSLSDSQNQLSGSVSTRRAKDEPLGDGPTRRALGSANQEEGGDQDVGLGAPCHTSAQPIVKKTRHRKPLEGTDVNVEEYRVGAGPAESPERAPPRTTRYHR